MNARGAALAIAKGGIFFLAALNILWIFAQSPVVNRSVRVEADSGEWRVDGAGLMYEAPAYLRARALNALIAASNADETDIRRSAVNRARATATRSVRAAPADASAWVLLGWAEMLDGNDSAATDALVRSWSLAPNSLALASDRILLADALGMAEDDTGGDLLVAIRRDVTNLRDRGRSAYRTVKDAAPELVTRPAVRTTKPDEHSARVHRAREQRESGMNYQRGTPADVYDLERKPSGPVPDDDDGGIDIRQILGIVWRAKWKMVAGAILGLLLAAVQITSLDPTYTSSGTVLFSPERQNVVNLQEVLANQGRDSLTDQMVVLKSTNLMMEVVERLNLHRRADFNPALRPEKPLRDAIAKWTNWRTYVPWDLLRDIGIVSPPPPTPERTEAEIERSQKTKRATFSSERYRFHRFPTRMSFGSASRRAIRTCLHVS